MSQGQCTPTRRNSASLHGHAGQGGIPRRRRASAWPSATRSGCTTRRDPVRGPGRSTRSTRGGRWSASPRARRGGRAAPRRDVRGGRVGRRRVVDGGSRGVGTRRLDGVVVRAGRPDRRARGGHDRRGGRGDHPAAVGGGRLGPDAAEGGPAPPPPRRPEGSSALPPLSPSDVAASLVEERDAVLGISPRPPPGSPADDERGAALAGSERLVRCWEWIGRAERLCGLAGEGGRRRRIRRDPAGRLAGEEPRRLLRLGGREAAGDSAAVGGGGHGDVRSVLPSLSCDVYDSPMRR